MKVYEAKYKITQEFEPGFINPHFLCIADTWVDAERLLVEKLNSHIQTLTNKSEIKKYKQLIHRLDMAEFASEDNWTVYEEGIVSFSNGNY